MRRKVRADRRRELLKMRRIEALGFGVLQAMRLAELRSRHRLEDFTAGRTATQKRLAKTQECPLNEQEGINH